jgi:predicted nicotinamide N-methyase
MSIYKEERITLSLEGKTFDLLQIANIDEVFDALIALPDAHVDKADERIPYWTEIWPSALALSAFILNNKDQVEGKTILELGAGLGLPSLVAACFSSTVVCSDYLTDALIFARKNAELNAISYIQYECIDWRSYNSDQRYALILASDIAYEKRFFEDLPGSLKKMMYPESEVWLSEPGRHFTAPFIQDLKNHFDIKSYPLPQTWRGTTFQTSVHVLKLHT